MRPGGDANLEFFDKHSGTTPVSDEEMAEVRRENARWQPTIDPATVPAYDEVAAALNRPHSMVVEGFLLHGRVDDVDRQVRVLDWLRSGRNLERVLQVARHSLMGP